MRCLTPHQYCPGVLQPTGSGWDGSGKRWPRCRRRRLQPVRLAHAAAAGLVRARLQPATLLARVLRSRGARRRLLPGQSFPFPSPLPFPTPQPRPNILVTCLPAAHQPPCHTTILDGRKPGPQVNPPRADQRHIHLPPDAIGRRTEPMRKSRRYLQPPEEQLNNPPAAVPITAPPSLDIQQVGHQSNPVPRLVIPSLHLTQPMLRLPVLSARSPQSTHAQVFIGLAHQSQLIQLDSCLAVLFAQ